jgi:hypothetical protein
LRRAMDGGGSDCIEEGLWNGWWEIKHKRPYEGER